MISAVVSALAVQRQFPLTRWTVATYILSLVGNIADVLDPNSGSLCRGTEIV
jgi:hypothetical protein